ncbi:unnamed protein product [Amoebophrya sp. A25]|nr:unnamed protein product [Amoebophrya sp. A25]|eukprot:GSA25T00020786001.1
MFGGLFGSAPSTTVASTAPSTLPANAVSQTDMMSRKVIMVGDPQVGKTALSCAVTKRPVPKKYEPTPASEFFSLEQHLEGQSVRLNIWDCGFGGPDAALTLKGYFKNADIAVLVYDTTEADSFEGVKHWYSQIQNSPEECPDVRFLVVGTRSDLRNSGEYGNEDLAKDWCKEKENMGHLLCSSRTGSGIDVVMTHITRLALASSLSSSVLNLSVGVSGASTPPVGGGLGGSVQDLHFSNPSGLPVYKIAVLGALRTGKSAFLQKLLSDRPLDRDEYRYTSRVQKHTMQTSLLLADSDKEVILQIFEGGGEETLLEPSFQQFDGITKEMDAILFFADATNETTLKHADTFQMMCTKRQGLKVAALPQLLVGTLVSGGAGDSNSFYSASPLLSARASSMGILCAQIDLVRDSRSKCKELLQVIANTVYTWKSNSSKVGTYDRNHNAYGGVFNAHVPLKFRSGASSGGSLIPRTAPMTVIPTSTTTSSTRASMMNYSTGGVSSTLSRSGSSYLQQAAQPPVQSAQTEQSLPSQQQSSTTSTTVGASPSAYSIAKSNAAAAASTMAPSIVDSSAVAPPTTSTSVESTAAKPQVTTYSSAVSGGSYMSAYTSGAPPGNSVNNYIYSTTAAAGSTSAANTPAARTASSSKTSVATSTTAKQAGPTVVPAPPPAKPYVNPFEPPQKANPFEAKNASTTPACGGSQNVRRYDATSAYSESKAAPYGGAVAGSNYVPKSYVSQTAAQDPRSASKTQPSNAATGAQTPSKNPAPRSVEDTIYSASALVRSPPVTSTSQSGGTDKTATFYPGTGSTPTSTKPRSTGGPPPSGMVDASGPVEEVRFEVARAEAPTTTSTVTMGGRQEQPSVVEQSLMPTSYNISNYNSATSTGAGVAAAAAAPTTTTTTQQQQTQQQPAPYQGSFMLGGVRPQAGVSTQSGFQQSSTLTQSSFRIGTSFQPAGQKFSFGQPMQIGFRPMSPPLQRASALSPSPMDRQTKSMYGSSGTTVNSYVYGGMTTNPGTATATAYTPAIAYSATGATPSTSTAMNNTSYSTTSGEAATTVVLPMTTANTGATTTSSGAVKEAVQQQFQSMKQEIKQEPAAPALSLGWASWFK